MTKIQKILIANRGEIACRVMKTCRKMGIASVAVYSDADRKALHVRTADEAVHIGASPATESYLVIDKIIAACKATGADAVHPGYGFLSENPEFARRLKKEGIIFIGPSPESMEAMGLKDAAKKLMEKAGVPVTPGYHGKDQSAKLLKAKAGMIGYPVLIKAVAGGGGKGMRKVERADDFDDALASCMREAKSAFGDDRVLIEKYILSPRHIEVQVFGDTHGNVVHMYERDCSLQRRHQKVIEEAPAPGMTEDVRRAMTKAAIEAAKAVDYVGAGTVEFIVDGSGKLRKDGFWFMEMNTRLQVEHPVTEMITGLDLVELQIRVAQGEELPKQKEITMTGHAIEARLYAEEPANDFLPSIGTLLNFSPASDQEKWKHTHARFVEFMKQSEPLLVPPDERGDWRTDTGVTSGDEISMYYDPMIAKFISYSSHERFECIRSLVNLINLSKMEGVKTNSEFLKRCLFHPDFAYYKPDDIFQISTNMIADNLNMLCQIGLENQNKFIAIAAAALTFDLYEKTTNGNLFSGSSNWRLNYDQYLSWYFMKDDKVAKFTIEKGSPHSVRICCDDGEIITIDNKQKDSYLLQMGQMEKIIVNGTPKSTDDFQLWNAKISQDIVQILDGYYDIPIKRISPDSTSETSVGGNAITAPMPGKIIAVDAKAGDSVKAGDKLIIMEAMKMEMSLEAPRDGIVAAVHCAADALVSDGEVLLKLEEEKK